jgi:hypothetical protein
MDNKNTIEKPFIDKSVFRLQIKEYLELIGWQLKAFECKDSDHGRSGTKDKTPPTG